VGFEPKLSDFRLRVLKCYIERLYSNLAYCSKSVRVTYRVVLFASSSCLPFSWQWGISIILHVLVWWVGTFSVPGCQVWDSSIPFHRTHWRKERLGALNSLVRTEFLRWMLGWICELKMSDAILGKFWKTTYCKAGVFVTVYASILIMVPRLGAS
jgi:hypothetical protein